MLFERCKLFPHMQNISREHESRQLLLELANTIRFLSDLLFASTAQCQAMHLLPGICARINVTL